METPEELLHSRPVLFFNPWMDDLSLEKGNHVEFPPQCLTPRKSVWWRGCEYVMNIFFLRPVDFKTWLPWKLWIFLRWKLGIKNTHQQFLRQVDVPVFDVDGDWCPVGGVHQLLWGFTSWYGGSPVDMETLPYPILAMGLLISQLVSEICICHIQ